MNSYELFFVIDTCFMLLLLLCFLKTSETFSLWNINLAVWTVLQFSKNAFQLFLKDVLGEMSWNHDGYLENITVDVFTSMAD